MHGSPRLNLFGRQLLVERIEAGLSPVTAAEAAGVSRATAYKWIRRFRTEGWRGLHDRSCRPHRSPRQLSAAAEALIVELRRARKLGPHRLASLTERPRSTCYAVLRRHGLHRLAWLDRPTGLSSAIWTSRSWVESPGRRPSLSRPPGGHEHGPRLRLHPFPRR